MSGAAAAIGPAGTEARERAFAAARRHSGQVRFLKVAIPLGSALAVALVGLGSLYDPLGSFPGLTLGPLSVSGSRIAMENPRLTGYRKDTRPYEVTARAAYQDVRKPGIIELSDMRAKLALDESGRMANLVAGTGVFDTAKEHLDLFKDIRVTTTSGEEALLSSAAIDFKNGTVVSTEAVRIRTPTAAIEAGAMRISDNGRTIAFTGRVRAEFARLPGGVAPEPSPEPTTPSALLVGGARP